MFQCTCVCKCTPGALSSSSGISPSPVSVPWTHHCQFCTELPVVDSLTVLCRVAGREGSAAKGHSGLKLHQRLLRYLGSGYSLNTKTFLIHGLLSLETDNLCWKFCSERGSLSKENRCSQTLLQRRGSVYPGNAFIYMHLITQWREMGMSWQVAFWMKGHTVNYLFATFSLWNTKGVTRNAYSSPSPFILSFLLFISQKLNTISTDIGEYNTFGLVHCTCGMWVLLLILMVRIRKQWGLQH